MSKNEYDLKTKNRIIEELRALNIKRVIVEYSGSGDSGSIDEVAAFLADDNSTRQCITELAYAAAENDEVILLRIRDRLLGTTTPTLHARIESLCYAALDATDAPDWYNNDGGGGTMTLYVEDGKDDGGEEVAAGTIKFAHYYNVTEQIHSSFELP